MKLYYIYFFRVPFSIMNTQQIDIVRSKPVNMPATQNTVFIECGSANSREISPPQYTYHATASGDLEEKKFKENKLKENLADAMMESETGKQ